MKYQFIEYCEPQFPIHFLCQVMQVSRSAYYDYKNGRSHRPGSEHQQALQAVEKAFWDHKQRYGSRRLKVELEEMQGLCLGRHRIRQLMKQQELVAIQPRSFVARTTDSRHGKRICATLLLNQPLPSAPNQVWVGDITYLPLAEGKWGYLAQWMDLFSRMTVGWQLAAHMDDSLVITALEKALQWRKPAAGLIVHSDRGGQYVSSQLKMLLKKHDCRQSMSRADDPYDNAFAESFFSRLKAELLQGGAFLDLEDARTEIFDFIEMYYNRIRRHSALGYQSPLIFEQQYYYQLLS
jgi:putative transposase